KYLSASKGSSIVVTLMNDINVSRGDLIVKEKELPREAKQFSAVVCWMDKHLLETAAIFYLQHGVKAVKAKIKDIEYKLSTDGSGEKKKTHQLGMNDLGVIEVKLAQPLCFDAYDENKENGTFILIDPKSNMTAG